MSEFWMGEALRAAGVGALFLVVFAAAEVWRRAGSPPPEWTRKLVHFGGGVICLGLPWMVRSHWTVLVLGALFAAIIVVSRRFGLLSSIHGVERKSEGGLYFPVSVYLMFVLASGRPVFYLISILALVVSDALAALVGTTYGRLRFRVEGDRRSVEGSAVFFLSTFLAVHLPLLLLTPMDRAASVLVAVQLSLLVTLLEAISLEGNDNLIVPVGTFLLLLKLTPQPAGMIGLQLLAQLAILGALFVLAWRWRLLTSSGTLAASLFFYGAFSLGGPVWVVAPTAALAVFALWVRGKGAAAAPVPESADPDARYQVLAVFYTSVVIMAVVIADNVLETVVRDAPWGGVDRLYPAFLAALAAHLALLALLFSGPDSWVTSASPGRFAASCLLGIVTVLPVGFLVNPPVSASNVVAACAVPVLAVAGYIVANRTGRVPRVRPWDGRLQAVCTGAAIVLTLPFLLAGAR